MRTEVDNAFLCESEKVQFQNLILTGEINSYRTRIDTKFYEKNYCFDLFFVLVSSTSRWMALH